MVQMYKGPKKISKLPTKITPEIRQKVVELKKAGKLVSEIAKELDIVFKINHGMLL